MIPRLASIALVFLVVQCMPLSAQGPAFSRVLVPLLVPPENAVAGAHGSRWAAETWFLFPGNEAIEVRPRTNICIITCDQFREVLQPGSGPHRLRPDLNGDRGLFLYAPADRLPELTFQARVFDLSRAASAGTSLPVVSEHAFRQRTHILNVPLDGNVRVSLRLYSLPEVAGPEVAIRYFAMPPDDQDFPVTLLREDRVRLTTPVQRGGETLLFPSYTMVSNVHELPELSGRVSLWVEIASITEGALVWPLVSVTDNDTQYVMLLWPEPD